MKSTLRNLLSPILGLFESGEAKYSYSRSHRTILMVVGVLFLILSLISLASAVFTSQLAAGLPFIIFICVSAVCLIVGGLGSDHAVAKLWGSK